MNRCTLGYTCSSTKCKVPTDWILCYIKSNLYVLSLVQLAVASTINNELVMHVMSVCVDELSFFTKTYRGEPQDSAGIRENMCVRR